MAVKKKRKKRKKKSRYHTGSHKSPKCKAIVKYRSGWEKTVCEHLDANPDVLAYEYEELIIPYLANKKTGKIRNYFPDFLVYYKDGSRILVEVKRKNLLGNLIVKKKAKAAEEWCRKQQNVKYEFWTDPMIMTFRKMLTITKATPKKSG